MSEGRGYVLSGENLTLGTGSVLAAIQSAAAGNAGSHLAIERVEVSQNHNSSTAQLRLALGQRDTAGTLTVASATPNPLVLGGPASGIAGGTSPLTVATCGVNSSADSGGTYTNTYVCNPNNQGGFVWQPTEKNEILVPASKLFVVRFLAAPGDTAGWTVAVFFRELF
jgi:hypothetical protein